MKKILPLLLCAAVMAMLFGCAEQPQTGITAVVAQTAEPETGAFSEDVSLSVVIGSTWCGQRTYRLTADSIAVSARAFGGETTEVGTYPLPAEAFAQIQALAQAVDMNQAAYADEPLVADGLTATIYRNEKSICVNYREQNRWLPRPSDDALKLVQYIVSVSDRTAFNE